MRSVATRTANVTLVALALAWLVTASPAGQGGGTLQDPMRLTELKDFGAYRSSSNNEDLDSNDDSKRPIPGETVVLADLAGPGVVSHIWLTVAANEYGWPRLLRLRVYYDGSPHPSVDCPVGDFFAVGHGFERQVNSLMVRDSSSGRSRNSYWPMPFARRCRITITNEGRRRVSNLYYHVDWQKLRALPQGTAYFHAWYRQALPTVSGKPYEILSVNGRGHYVGTVLSVIQNEPGWFGEGDDFFYVDGERKARIEGTGTEDYFNDAWSLRVADGPYAGVPVAEGTGLGSRMTAYRWHLADPIPFKKSLRFVIEHKGWTYNANGSVRSAFEERADLFSSVAFWYQAGIATGQPEPPYGFRRLPQANAQQIEVETLLPDVKTENGTASIQKEVFWSKDLLFFDGRGPGATLDIPLDVAEDGTYEVIAQVAHSPDYGNYKVLVDGRPPGGPGDLEHEPGATGPVAPVINAYFPETYVAEDHLVGWLKLTKGRHRVAFVCTGKSAESSGYFLGVDTLILARLASEALRLAGPSTTRSGQASQSDRSDVTATVAKAVRLADTTIARSRRADDLRHIGERGAAGAIRLQQLVAALKDTNDEVREAAAWSLGQLGAAAASAEPTLRAALSDEDAVVRGLAALALGALGKAAAPSLDTLISHLKDEDVNVRMVAAQSIGRQGRAAARAVDPLIEAARRPGEHVHAQRAIATALGKIGPGAERAIPVLQDLARIPRVEWAAKRAISDIRGTR